MFRHDPARLMTAMERPRSAGSRTKDRRRRPARAIGDLPPAEYEVIYYR